jgi:NNP family nitrate/nitrite transporter-like MFS transporter
MKAAKTPAEKLLIAHAHADWSITGLWVFMGSYVVLAGMTWLVYIRRRPEPRSVPALADVSV